MRFLFLMVIPTAIPFPFCIHCAHHEIKEPSCQEMFSEQDTIHTSKRGVNTFVLTDDLRRKEILRCGTSYDMILVGHLCRK